MLYEKATFVNCCYNFNFIGYDDYNISRCRRYLYREVQNILEVTKFLYLCIVFTTVRNLQRSRTLNQLISVLFCI